MTNGLHCGILVHKIAVLPKKLKGSGHSYGQDMADYIKAGTLDPWREEITALASEPNVWCKISGMVTEADHEQWRYEDFIPYLDTVIEAFGTDRIMLGSDWPVCRLAGEYDQIMDIPVRYFKDLGSADKERIFSLNCIECYELTNL